MDVYLARQPIFDRQQRVFAYEFLCQDCPSDAYAPGDVPPSNAILNSFDLIGIQNLTGGKRAIVKFNGMLIRQGVATLFSKEHLAVEIPADVSPEEEILKELRLLKEKGYLLVAESFVLNAGYEWLAEIVDIIKVDLSRIESDGLKEAAIIAQQGVISFLATGIETRSDFERAREWGCRYFQGFFFSKSDILSVHDIQPMRFHYLRLIKEINKEEMDFDSISDIVANDVSLSYKLLKLVNSVAFGFTNRIRSVRHALVALGSLEIKKWASLVAFKGIGEGQNDELIQLSLVRAKFCEILSSSSQYRNQAEELFMMGLFSSLDALMHRPMEEVLGDLPIPDEVRSALLTGEGPYGDFYRMMLYYEKGDWDRVTKLGEQMGFERKRISQAYLDAVSWSVRLEKEAVTA
jgi:c-di-GMP-related signal transduction protein